VFGFPLSNSMTSSSIGRPRINLRNVASVFASRPRYILIDTSDNMTMLIPGTDGYFRFAVVVVVFGFGFDFLIFFFFFFFFFFSL
jgi:hypothetical protein